MMVSRVSLVPRVVVMAVSGTTTFELISVSEDRRTRTLLEGAASLPAPSSSALCDGTSSSILQKRWKQLVMWIYSWMSALLLDVVCVTHAASLCASIEVKTYSDDVAGYSDTRRDLVVRMLMNPW